MAYRALSTSFVALSKAAWFTDSSRALCSLRLHLVQLLFTLLSVLLPVLHCMLMYRAITARLSASVPKSATVRSLLTRRTLNRLVCLRFAATRVLRQCASCVRCLVFEECALWLWQRSPTQHSLHIVDTITVDLDVPSASAYNTMICCLRVYCFRHVTADQYHAATWGPECRSHSVCSWPIAGSAAWR